MSALLGMSLARHRPADQRPYLPETGVLKKKQKHHRYVGPRSEENRNRSDYY